VNVWDRAFYSSVHYPTDYGFVHRTRGVDGEALDTMVIVYKRGPVRLSSMNVQAVLRVRTTTLGPRAAESQLVGYNDV
jgi:inorganic pyrophosphatase